MLSLIPLSRWLAARFGYFGPGCSLTTLAESHELELDGGRKANMVNSLLVVICGERQAQLVINSGSLY